jgi:hypothetical protein
MKLLDTAFLETLEGEPTLTSEKLVDLKQLYKRTIEMADLSGFIFFEGEAKGIEEALRIIYKAPDIVEVAKSSHTLRKIVVVGVVVGSVVYYRRRKQEKRDEG